MFSVSQQQAGQRWDSITPQLREALFSDINADFVWNLCQSEHLSKEQSYQVAEFAGYVLLGFIHPEDLAQELASSINLPPQLTKTISEKINSRIFTPLRADIDKVYSPLIVEKSAAAPVPLALNNSEAINKPISQGAGISISIPKPTTLSDVGWSKMPPPTTAAISGIKPSAPPVPSPAHTDPAPVMLHEDTTFKAPEKNAGFTLSRPGAGADMHMGQSGGGVPTPPRPAVLEFGGVKPPQATAPVHYTELKPSLSATPAANTGPRSVSQIGMPPSATQNVAAPAVPMPPRPPQAPLPQAPQPPQSNKPIVKDFL